MTRFALLLLLAAAQAHAVHAQEVPRPSPQMIEDLVAANRILAKEGVLDGWGHVSVRLSPHHFLMAKAVPPGLVQANDLYVWDLDARPVSGKPDDSYSERFIHAEIYRARADVHAVVHNHAPALIPFGVSSVPLRPLYHRSSFIGLGVPVFEIRERFGMTDLLIRNAALGKALAETLGDKPAALMRGHGVTVVGPSIPRVVSRSIFLALNATLQLQAMSLGQPITYMDVEETRLIEAREGHGLKRAWEAWKQNALGK